ncbi:MAG: hypothetical protein AAF642_19010 [Pseudomonadota bacterium]
MIARHAIYRLVGDGRLVIVLSYPGLERGGSVVVAPLLSAEEIAIIPVLHPKITTPVGDRYVIVERLAAIAFQELDAELARFEDNQFELSHALSRLFDGT